MYELYDLTLGFSVMKGTQRECRDFTNAVGIPLTHRLTDGVVVLSGREGPLYEIRPLSTTIIEQSYVAVEVTADDEAEFASDEDDSLPSPVKEVFVDWQHNVTHEPRPMSRTPLLDELLAEARARLGR